MTNLKIVGANNDKSARKSIISTRRNSPQSLKPPTERNNSKGGETLRRGSNETSPRLIAQAARKLEHWEGSHTQLSYIRNNLKQMGYQDMEDMQDQSVMLQFPNLKFKELKNGKIDVEIKTRQPGLQPQKLQPSVVLPRKSNNINRYIHGL